MRSARGSGGGELAPAPIGEDRAHSDADPTSHGAASACGMAHQMHILADPRWVPRPARRISGLAPDTNSAPPSNSTLST